jgi:hypothetical protein
LDTPLEKPLDADYGLDFGNARQGIEEHNILKTWIACLQLR